MFEQSEYRVVPGSGEELMQSVPARIGQVSGCQLAQVSPVAWSGRSVGKSWNISLTLAVQVSAAQGGGTAVQITTGADVDQTGWILFILACIFFWPAAALIGFLAYDDFNKRRGYTVQQIWMQLGAGAPPPPQSPYGVR